MAQALVPILINAAVSYGISYLLAPDGPDVEGPRLQDRGINQNSYGAVMPRVYGLMIVTGSLSWLLNNELTEVATTERQGGKGGGGGSKVTTYAYSFSGHFSIHDGQINGVQRVWGDTTLLYDQFDESSSSLFGVSQYDFDTYLGADDQTQHPEESGEKGLDSTPGYRGTAILAATDMPLEEFGNRIPNVQCEVAGLGTYGLEDGAQLIVKKVGDLNQRVPVKDPISFGNAGEGAGLRSNSGVLIISDPIDSVNSGLDRLDGYHFRHSSLASPPKSILNSIAYGDLQPYVNSGEVVRQAAFTRNGNRYMMMRFGFGNIHAWYDVALRRFIHGPVNDDSALPSWVGGVRTVAKQSTSFHQSSDLAETGGYLWSFDYDGTPGSDVFLVVHSKHNQDPSPVQSWNLTELFGIYGGTGESYLPQMDGDQSQQFVTVWWREGTSAPRRGLVFSDALIFSGAPPQTLFIPSSSIESPYRLHYNPIKNWILGTSDTVLHLFDAVTGDEILAEPGFFSSQSSVRKFFCWWVGPTSFTDGYSIWEFVVDPSEDPNGDENTPGVDLAEVVKLECIRCGISESDIDVSALEGTNVRGYAITDVQSGKSSLDPLTIAYQFEVYEEDYKLKARFKDRSSILTLTEDDMRPHPAGTSAGQFIEIEQVEETKLPRRVNVNYMNFNSDYEPDTQFSERSASATVSEHVAEVSMNMSFTPTFTRQLSDKLLREAWVSRLTYKFSLPKKFSYLTPTDVVTLDIDDFTVDARILELALGVDGRLEISAVAHSQAVYSSSAVTESPINTNPTSPPLRNALVDFFIIDGNELPFSQGVTDGNFPVYLAGWSLNFQGYQLQQSVDNGESWDNVGVAQLNQAIVGYVTSPIGDIRDDFAGVFDPVDTLGVYFFDSNPDISSATDLQVQGGQNVFAVGSEGRWEYIGASNVTQVDEHNFDLTRLLRGVQGTEYNASSMQEGDVVVLLNTQTVGQFSVPVDKIGSTVLYRAVYGTRLPSPDFDKSVTHQGNPIKEYAPANITAWRNSGNGLNVYWNRRTRVGGEWRDGVDAYIASDSRPREFTVRFYDGNTLLRTYAGLTESKVLYSNVDQVADSAPASLRVEIEQVSASGTSHIGTATI